MIQRMLGIWSLLPLPLWNPACTSSIHLKSGVQLFCDPMDCSPGNSPSQNTGGRSCSLLQGIFSTQGSNPGLLHWRWILFLQRIFPAQESNWDLLHCRWILYQLSYQGSQVSNIVEIKDKCAKNSNLRHTSSPQQKYKVCEESGQAVWSCGFRQVWWKVVLDVDSE